MAPDATGQMSEKDLRQSALLNYQMAEHYAEENDHRHARNCYFHAIENISGIDEGDRELSDLAILYNSCTSLGRGFRDEGDKEQSARYWEKAFEANTRLLALNPADYTRYNSAGVSSQWAGLNYLEAGRSEDALRCYRAGLEQIREGEARAGVAFLHCDMEGRMFDCFHAEACYRIAEIEGDDPMADARDVSNMAAECIRELTTVYRLLDEEGRLYDIVRGTYLCAMCMKDGDRAKYLEMADSLCTDSLDAVSDRARFTEIQDRIRAAKRR